MQRPVHTIAVTICTLLSASSSASAQQPTAPPAEAPAPPADQAPVAEPPTTAAPEDAAPPAAPPATGEAASSTDATAEPQTEATPPAGDEVEAAGGTAAEGEAGSAAPTPPEAPAAATAAPPPAPPPVVEQAPPPSVSPAPAAPPPLEVPMPRARGPKLYVRLAAGIGFPFGFDVADRYAELDAERTRFSGFALATDLMVGTPVADWIAVGGGAVSDTITSGEIEERDGNTLDLERNLYLAMLGPFVDIYPNAPAGFHVQALVGIAHLSRARNLGDDEAVGPGAAVAIGYEWRASSRWNVGVLGRMTVAPLSMDPVDGVTRSPAFYQPSILISATMQP